MFYSFTKYTFTLPCILQIIELIPDLRYVSNFAISDEMLTNAVLPEQYNFLQQNQTFMCTQQNSVRKCRRINPALSPIHSHMYSECKRFFIYPHNVQFSMCKSAKKKKFFSSKFELKTKVYRNENWNAVLWQHTQIPNTRDCIHGITFYGAIRLYQTGCLPFHSNQHVAMCEWWWWWRWKMSMAARLHPMATERMM